MIHYIQYILHHGFKNHKIASKESHLLKAFQMIPTASDRQHGLGDFNVWQMKQTTLINIWVINLYAKAQFMLNFLFKDSFTHVISLNLIWNSKLYM
jgi:hypothetical protein